jgi:uncharacterized membrane protein YeaQ/YmgE (transglycosylase-associated protein family)
MEGFGWIMTIVLGGLAGWGAEKIMKFDTGLMMNIGIGIGGALVGNFLLRAIVGSTFGGVFGQLVVALAGACGLIYGYKAIKSRN